MKIAISSETTVDLTKELLKEYDIHTVPFTIIMGEDQVADGEITPEEIFSFHNRTKILPRTSAVNEYQYENHFQDLLKSYDAIIHISLSSALSVAYTNASNVAKKLNNVTVIDSKSLSTGIALLCLHAQKLVRAGERLSNIINSIYERIPFVQASFALEKVDYLYKGGRCSLLSFIGANLLGIKPQIIVKDGKMIPGRKYRGKMMRVVKQYVDDTLLYYGNPDLEQVFITYTTADDEIIEMVQAILKGRGFKRIDITRAGGTISSHCGENCLGILYINDGDR
jgi:DegV family protein with EDD domain